MSESYPSSASPTLARGAPLFGRGIVVTRPREQSARLAAGIQAAGGLALVFPAIEIADIEDVQSLRPLIERLHAFDFAVFVSPSAVRKGLQMVRLLRGSQAWPSHVRVAAIGRGSRRELEEHGVQHVVAPELHADSEALLALPQMKQVNGSRFIIFRGDSGRELLGDTLVARGASVEYAGCYRRVRPCPDAGPLLAAWATGAVHAVTATSTQGLGNLFEILGDRGEPLLRRTPMFVSHDRVGREAGRFGIEKVVSAGTSDDEMLESLVAYFGGAK